jgi:hypothetical protein
MDNLTAIIVQVPYTFNWEAGRDNYLKLTTLDPNNVLLIPPSGAPAGTVGLPACEILAGPGYGGYGRANTLDSLATWVVPLLILVVNLNYSSFGRQAYWNQATIALHLFGNPIHAMWALLTKLDVKRRIGLRCRDAFLTRGLKQKDIWIYSTILYALDDFDFSMDFEVHFDRLMEIAASNRSDLKNACRRAAIDMTIARVNNTRRAVFAILGYLAAITASIIRANFSGSIPIHYSHTIALRELNYWIIAAILLSAAVGGLPSEWTSVGILMDLQSRTCLDFGINRLRPWRGGNHTWRPEKDVSTTISRVPDKRHLVLALLAFGSVTTAAFNSFLMSYFTPTRGVGIRSLVEIIYWAWWCANAIAMYLIGRCRIHWTTTQRGWLFIIAKDSLFALFTILFLLSAWNGWWNSCYHWSMALQLGKDKAYIDLVGMKGQILWLMKKPFPIAMALGTAAQIALAFTMIWYAQGGAEPPAMDEKDAEAYFTRILEGGVPATSPSGIGSISVVDGVDVKQQSRSQVTLLKHNGSLAFAMPPKAIISVREGWEMDSLPGHERL